MGIKKGDIVKLKADAVYYDGTAIPEFVKKDKWIVESVTGDRAVINRNANGTKSICSPVRTSYLSKVTPKKTENMGKSKDSSKDSQKGNVVKRKQMQISPRGVELIAGYEGCKLTAYRCPAGVLTIGYGHTKGVREGDKLSSKKEAKELLCKDLKEYAGYVNQLVADGTIQFPLNQNQFDALTSFVYNCGFENLKTLVRNRGAATVAEKMLLYTNKGLPGLVRRRKEERDLFLK